MPNTTFAPIAIVSLSGIFPLAFSAEDFWRNIVGKVDAAVKIPAARWVDPADWVYNRSPEPDMAYSRRACLVEGFRFDPSGFNLNADLLQTLDPLHQWVLHASRDALINCRTAINGKRTGVILAAIALPTDLSSEISRRFLGRRFFEASAVKKSSYRMSAGESLCARVVSSPAVVVSHALGLEGVCYTLDAACASSLYALKLACDALHDFRADTMLAGGVSRPDCLYTQVGFSQLRALSPSGHCAPFDWRADGLVVGEGAGVMVLKRLEDAVEAGDRVYGVIRGIGLSNDMRGNLLAPESAGQVRAMQMAYAKAGWHPHTVDYVECHGAGTPVGDATELNSLKVLWGDNGWTDGQCALGSVKSMIGHLLTGAGAAGMIKTLLALHHKTLPPSLNFERPAAGSPLINGPFRVQTEARSWPSRDDGSPRRAAVSAFGFGGINAHVLVQEWPDTSCGQIAGVDCGEPSRGIEVGSQKNGIAIVGLDITLGTLASVQQFQQAVFNGRSVLTQVPPGRWRVPEAVEPLPGAFVDKIEIELGEFQIPPGEIPDILPQQLLMLKKAAGAMTDAGLPLHQMRERMGAVIGISFDYEAANFQLRWALPKLASEYQAVSGFPIDPESLSKWLNETKALCGPPLTAARTLGALGGIVASRIAREFRLGGPSFVVSAEEASGLRALGIAADMLRAGEVDAMLVGAVDLNCDERNLATIFHRLEASPAGEIRAFDQRADGTLEGEGAVALVLKRLDDAIENKDRIYAVVEGTGSAAGWADNGSRPALSAYSAALISALKEARVDPAGIGMMETHGSGIPSQDQLEAQALLGIFGDDPDRGPDNPLVIGTLKPLVGHTGATSGLASLVKAVLSLHHRIIPPLANFEAAAQLQWRQGHFHMPVKAAYWAQNRLDGPRKSCVASITSDGHCAHAVLSDVPEACNAECLIEVRDRRPAGDLPCALFLIKGSDAGGLLEELDQLEHRLPMLDGRTETRLQILARDWHRRTRTRPAGGHCLAIVSGSFERLEAYLDMARQAVTTSTACSMDGRGGVCYLPGAVELQKQMAFVYPGSGNHYVGMGRDIGMHWPEVLRAMEAVTDRFESQMLPRWYDPYRVDWLPGWRQEAYENLVADPLRTIFGQVLFGGQMTEVLRQFGLYPDAVIGYSLGESAGLFAMGAWPDRGVMLERLETSDLFKTQLAGSCDSVHQAWNIPDDKPVTWRVAAVNRSKQIVDEAIAGLPHVRRLIVNTPTQCVIGGLQKEIETAIKAMRCEAVYLDGVVTVHCDAALPCAQAYKDLHRFPTTPVEHVRFYSCAHEKAYELTSEAAAESITRQALQGFDFPRTIQQAYADGVRIFVEVGPHCSCARMIDQILEDKPHLAVAANHRSEYEPLTLLKCIGTLAAIGLEIDLDNHYGDTEPVRGPKPSHPILDQQKPLGEKASESTSSGPLKHPRAIEVTVGGGPLLHGPAFPAPSPKARQREPKFETGTMPGAQDRPTDGSIAEHHAQPPVQGASWDFSAMFAGFNANIETTARAHEKFLSLSQELTDRYAQTFELQNRLLAGLQAEPGQLHEPQPMPSPSKAPNKIAHAPQMVFNREQCLDFAIGSVGKMLGPDFAIVDTFKARVRLPDEPLMLVDRIVTLEGEKLSLSAGRVVTEHDVLPGAWYLDGGRVPVCISVEAGQADLFLSSYLGIDHMVRGIRTYRLLDARIRFHRGLPEPGDTIQYDIHIDKFVRQEETYLFFFRFEGYIGNQHLITMTDGCAGFFTEAEVRNSGGIILTEDDKKTVTSIGGIPYEPLVRLADETYDDHRIEALRRGDAAACFGADFEGIQLPAALCLPGGRMRLIHRVVALQPWGGRFGKGYIRAEADIHPDDWFLTCHFVDDMVMPGTLMYECCAHTLRVLLMRLGWVTDKPETAYEPAQGVECHLKCRGPVTPATRKVHYAVEIKEIGYHPEPYVIADAHMYADGHYIVFFKDMTMQMTGVAHQDILDFWNRRGTGGQYPPSGSSDARSKALFSREHILAFAVGKPSEAFGRPYEIFDQDRTIARLPGPPYCFMDRVTSIEPEPWVLQAGGWVEAQYDVPADAWYFAADRSGVMPYCVLLEIALQPCGWLAAFVGSALRSQNDLKFRNLGGKATVQMIPTPVEQTLTMRTCITKVSEAADMIIEHFDFEVLNQGHPVFSGTTYFGFFTADALARQVGLRETAYNPDERDLSTDVTQEIGATPPWHPEDVPQGLIFRPDGLALPGKSLCMIDTIECYNPVGGPHGLGFIRGHKTVDPDEWFFKAHFFQDPVCPGSLGIESFLQLIKYAALQRWKPLERAHRFEIIGACEHQWTYRGQVVPTNQKVTVDAVITRIEEGPEPLIMADGWLHVDGIPIYSMVGYGFKLASL